MITTPLVTPLQDTTITVSYEYMMLSLPKIKDVQYGIGRMVLRHFSDRRQESA